MKGFPQLTEQEESELAENLNQWSLANGFIMYPPNFETYGATVAPTTLFPTPFPRLSFDNALAVQKTFNELYINVVAKHRDWLINIIRELSAFDRDFTGRLFDSYNEAIKQSPNNTLVQPVSLALVRSDYMVDTKGLAPQIKQVEFNTVSVSFGALSSKVGQLHNHLNSSGYYGGKKYYTEKELPISNSVNELVEGLAEANAYYNKNEDRDTIVLFVVQPNERNCFDQRLLEYALLENHKIRSRRITLEEVKDKVTTKGDKVFLGENEISVVYYRSGYSPGDYEKEPELSWAARVILEKSSAVKCPSLLTQLSGSKKIQQILTSAETIKKFLPDIDSEELKTLLSSFVAIYPLDDTEEGKLAKKLAFEQPQKFVLKPQREGGGNNIYKNDIPGFLKTLEEKDWDAYILMELIEAPTYKNKIIRNNKIYNEEIISELGVFGTYLFNEDTKEILSNKNAGWLLRSKFSSSDEGGVAAGFGCVDNIYLY